jgi:hypothetical protein
MAGVAAAVMNGQMVAHHINRLQPDAVAAELLPAVEPSALEAIMASALSSANPAVREVCATSASFTL